MCFHFLCFFMLIWSSSWSGPGFPSLSVFFGRLQQPPDLGPHRRLPLVCTRWWCELWWGYKAAGMGREEGGGGGSGFGLWKLLCWSWSGCLAEGPSVYIEGWTPGPAATVWAHCVAEAKQIAYLNWINRGTKKLLTGAKGPAACLSTPVTLILIVTIIPREAAAIDNWQGNALRMKLKPLTLFTPAAQMRSMPSRTVEAEGSANVKIVVSTSRIPVCCKSAPLASQNHHRITANLAMFLSKPKVRTDNEKCVFY